MKLKKNSTSEFFERGDLNFPPLVPADYVQNQNKPKSKIKKKLIDFKNQLDKHDDNNIHLFWMFSTF